MHDLSVIHRYIYREREVKKLYRNNLSNGFPSISIVSFFLILSIILLGEGNLKKGDPSVLDLDSESPRRRHSPYFRLGALHCLPP